MKITEILTISHLTKNGLNHLAKKKGKLGFLSISDHSIDEYGFCTLQMIRTSYPTVFLDIDGVLIPDTKEEQSHAYQLFEDGKINTIQFCHTRMRHLKDLVESTGAKIRVHSRWRYRGFTDSDFRTILISNGMNPEHLHDELRCKIAALSSDVWQDIAASKSHVCGHIILDDREPYMDYHKRVQVTTTPDVGLTEADSLKAKLLLLDEIQDYLDSN